MCTAVDDGEIIILSDDEDEEDDVPCSEPSICIVEVEEVKTKEPALSPAPLGEDDLVVTFCRRAEVLPHARFDCPLQPFTPSDCETSAPVAQNQLTCDQCFCYVCDKPASSCDVWSHGGVCHCNSHKRSDFWTQLRSSALLGGLQSFGLTLSEVDAPLRRAEMMLQSFRQQLAAAFSCFMRGRTVEVNVNQQVQHGLIYDYTPVYELVCTFLNAADEQDERAAAVMRLGAAEDFVRHGHVSGSFIVNSATGNAAAAKRLLLHRVISSVRRQMVTAEFSPTFSCKLQDFYRKLSFPPELRNLRNSLGVRPWDDVLLVSVLKGQNVSGVRKDKGKKDVLTEQISVVLLRTEQLQLQHRYRELCRYLRVVQTEDVQLLQQVRDLVPFFLCMEADLTAAVDALLSPVNAPASRFTPRLFLFYLRLFATATAPKLVASEPSQLCFVSEAPWEPIRGAAPLRREAQVKFALRAQRCCSAVFRDSQCWTSFLTLVNSPGGAVAVAPPSPRFLQEAKDVVHKILLDQRRTQIQIPRCFLEVFPDQALLLLATGALGVRILDSALRPALPVLSTFRENVWAVEWLWDSLSSRGEDLSSFLQEVSEEMDSASDEDQLLRFLQAVVSSAQTWDQLNLSSPPTGSPAAVRLRPPPITPCQLSS